MKYYATELKRIDAENFYLINAISFCRVKKLQVLFYLLFYFFLNRPYIHSYLRLKGMTDICVVEVVHQELLLPFYYLKEISKSL